MWMNINNSFIIRIDRDMKVEVIDQIFQERVEFIKSMITSETRIEDMKGIITQSYMYINVKYLKCSYKGFQFKELEAEE
jgi:hypothetical protein